MKSFKILFTFAFVLCFGMSYGQLTVNGSNNVGVKNSSPTEVLDVNGNIVIPNSQFYLSLRSDAATKQQVFGMDSNDDITFNRSALTRQQTSGLIFGFADKFIDFRNKTNTTLVRVTPSGDMGIGTRTPTAKLEVVGDIKANNVSFQDPNDSNRFINITDVVTELNTVIQELREENEELRMRLDSIEE